MWPYPREVFDRYIIGIRVQHYLMSGQLPLCWVPSDYVDDDELTIHEQRECDRIPYQEQERKHT